MPTLIQVYNAALSLCGSQQMTTDTEVSTVGDLVRSRWEFIRDSMLAKNEWGFAIRRASLVAVTGEPLYGFSYAWQLPTDCLRVLSTEDEEEYQVDGYRLLSDSDSMNIRYISRVTDTSSIPPVLLDAMTARLAFEVAFALHGNSQQVQSLGQLSMQREHEAISANTRESFDRYNDAVDWIEARL